MEHPLGVGPGNYAFSYIPYHRAVERDPEVTESNSVTLPHNAFLEVAANNGVSALVFLLILLGFLLRGAGIEMAILAFILVDGFFAFPMDVPYLFFSTAVFGGLLLKRHPSLSIPQKFAGAGAAITALLVVFFSAKFTYSQYVQALKPDDLEANIFACHLLPSNWRVCLQQVALETAYRMNEEAEASATRLLEGNENNFLISGFLIQVLVAQNRIPEACEWINRNDLLLGERGGFHAARLRLCH